MRRARVAVNTVRSQLGDGKSGYLRSLICRQIRSGLNSPLKTDPREVNTHFPERRLLDFIVTLF